MGLFDKLNGTKHPCGDVPPQPAEDVKRALLGLNGPDVPYVVRYGADEGAHLVAEWRLMEPAWQSFFASSQMSRRIRIRMRLDPGSHEVRVLEEQWKDPVGRRRAGIAGIRARACEPEVGPVDDRTQGSGQRARGDGDVPLRQRGTEGTSPKHGTQGWLDLARSVARQTVREAEHRAAVSCVQTDSAADANLLHIPVTTPAWSARTTSSRTAAVHPVRQGGCSRRRATDRRIPG